ncbi:MAG: DUF1972 domain-containing protein [Piscinibacter sp.]|uniref:DUF1972 domain-containing protein n=1 Tax=Piscinibacter sp. TaxID=1903157 RepID=UPI002587E859|nr:DUF1972 domain-containing protein [Piscinibacter sp.]MCW5667776.1 DUF1972 domain-containing protein [Piscinibacter sp.]
MNSDDQRPALRILGIRGVPAAHGGFETFAERLALHLVARGWRVVVYCQRDGRGPLAHDHWQGVERVHVPVAQRGALGTMVFDARAIRHAARSRELCLTLGYNTALFCAWLRLRGVPNLINMDGIEWSRAKWSAPARAWLWLNERAGCRLGDHLVADHPEIARHLGTRTAATRIATIAYGADRVLDAPTAPVRALGLEPGGYLMLVARPEPENSILEVVEGFSRRPRGLPLVVLGRYDPADPYHRRVQQRAGTEARFVGAIYERATLQALRRHALAYVHGHRVGGTNPSLVEALGAGNAVLAHDNRFNRWVAGAAGAWFTDADGFDTQLTALLADPGRLAALRHAARARFEQAFTWPAILAEYETLLRAWLPEPPLRPVDAGRGTA